MTRPQVTPAVEAALLGVAAQVESHPLGETEMTTSDLDRLKGYIESLDSAAIPTKSEVFVVCGASAAQMRDDLKSLLERLERVEGALERARHILLAAASRMTRLGQDESARALEDEAADLAALSPQED